jgi:hypothetical protein
LYISQQQLIDNMENPEDNIHQTKNIQFHMSFENRHRLEALPWHVPLEEWPDHGIIPLSIRRGMSRHPVLFVESQATRYAIKETTPNMAEREIRILHEVERRGIPSLSPVGSVVVPAPPVLLNEQGPGGVPEYISGDRGYTVTKLAPRVIPQALLYRIPFTRKNKQRILAAIAVLMIELHEHGVYWGDPSLANILVRLDGRNILAIMADAETAELFSGPISDELREQDIESFGEALLWEAEDLRYAQGLEEEEQIVDDKDFRYFKQRYRLLRREHKQLTSPSAFTSLFQVERMLESLNKVGYSLLDMSGHAFQQVATVMPGWYQRKIHELLGITVPRQYARRFYNTILGHQAMMSQHERRDVTLEEAAEHWYTYYHLPAILLLRLHLTSNQDPMQIYFAIMDYKWKLSMKAGYEIPIDEAVLAWAMKQAKTGKLGAVDPAVMASWWSEREPVMEALEPPSIASEKLEPLLSQEEQPLVRLPASELDDKLDEILDQVKPERNEE